jgi:hypothetical protein
MYLEAPMDAWYVWVGVALVSIGLAAFAVSLPSQPPPDAEGAAGAIDRVGASEYEAATTLDHDAEEVRVGPERIGMRNDGGTARATVSFGPVLPVQALDLNSSERRALDGFLAGEQPLQAGLEATLADAVGQLETETGEWRPATGPLRARSVVIEAQRVVLVAV